VCVRTCVSLLFFGGVGAGERVTKQPDLYFFDQFFLEVQFVSSLYIISPCIIFLFVFQFSCFQFKPVCYF
jgi:hypothetical protein